MPVPGGGSGSTRPIVALAPGTRIGPYDILGTLGAGGMGEVYRARDTKLGRDVAIKVLPALLASDPERVARFRREAQILATLNHPNIAAIYALEESEGMLALVLELVEGPTLADRLSAGPMPVDEALTVARQTADALEAAHARRVIHRDLKPANIKITRREALRSSSRDRLEQDQPAATVTDPIVKVLDFGLAKAAGDRVLSEMSGLPTVEATREGMILGTASYMSPEQARGLTVDERTDVWAFGCVLYEMLAGRKTFQGDTMADCLAAVLRKLSMTLRVCRGKVSHGSR
jgi:serine/threonine-protein kinase